MYPLGVLFGLGFDTSSEIALLGIASIQAARGTSIWLILLFPCLFTGGMCLIDTIDGALMMALYTSSTVARDAIAILYYNIVLTSITVVVALVIGTFQIFSLILSISTLTGSFWNGVQDALDHYDIIGGSICGLFVVAGCMSVICYRPWRRHVGGKLDGRKDRDALNSLEERGQQDNVDLYQLRVPKSSTSENDRGFNHAVDVTAQSAT